MNRDDIIRMAREAGWSDELLEVSFTAPLLDRFAALVAAEKDKEIEALRRDAKRLDWCISVLHRQYKEHSYLVTDAGCGCCGDGRHFGRSIPGRDAIDAAMGDK